MLGAQQLRIRPIRADDLQLTTEFAESLSQRSRYLRFFSTRRLSEAELRRFTDIDPLREHAVIALAREGGRERQVGVARFVDVEPAGDSEFAVVVTDAWQGRGVARALLCALVDAARRHGVRRLVGTVLAENTAMLALGREMGFEVARDRAHAVLSRLVLDVQPAVIH
jgi:acetyltransferase